MKPRVEWAEAQRPSAQPWVAWLKTNTNPNGVALKPDRATPMGFSFHRVRLPRVARFLAVAWDRFTLGWNGGVPLGL